MKLLIGDPGVTALLLFLRSPVHREAPLSGHFLYFTTGIP